MRYVVLRGKPGFLIVRGTLLGGFSILKEGTFAAICIQPALQLLESLLQLFDNLGKAEDFLVLRGDMSLQLVQLALEMGYRIRSGIHIGETMMMVDGRANLKCKGSA